MTASAAAAVPPTAASHPGRSAMLLYGLLGFSAGLPFYMFSTVLALRLQAHGVALTGVRTIADIDSTIIAP